MNILHVITSIYKDGGGTSEVVPRICLSQKDNGNDVTLAVLNDNMPISLTGENAINQGVKIIKFQRDTIYPHYIGISSDMKKGIASLVHNSDLIHLHGLWQAPCWYAASECRKQNKPYVIMPHGFLNPERLKISYFKKRIIAWLIENRNLNNAAGLIATSESEMKGLRSYGLKNPIHIMPIGIDLEHYMVNSSSHKSLTNNESISNKHILLFFSRISPIKGLDLLAEAWSHIQKQNFSNWTLHIIGPDDRGYKGKISKLYREICPPNSYEFHEPVYGDEKYKILSKSSAFILPTRNENWSIAVAEAMASGLPVICTKGAPWPCLGENWVDISVEGIENGLLRIMSASDQERYEIGSQNRKWIAENLNWSIITENMIQFYKHILQVRNG